jgi:hypothetical protein
LFNQRYHWEAQQRSFVVAHPRPQRAGRSSGIFRQASHCSEDS